jgi:signal transduction histidine kinase
MKFLGYLLLVVFLALICKPVFSQKTRATKVADSVQNKLLNAKNLNDSLDIIFFATERYIDLIPDYSASLIEQLKPFVKAFTPLQTVKYSLTKGNLAIIRNRFDDALRFFKEAQHVAKDNQLVSLEQDAAFLSAETMFLQADLSNAKLLLLELLKSPNLSDYNKVRSYLVLGKVSYFEGQFAQSLNYSNQGLKICAVGCRPELQIELYVLKGDAYMEKGSFVEAISILLKAKRMAQNADLLNYQSAVYNSIGIVFMTINNPKQAISWFEQALILCEELQNDARLADIYNNLGSSWLSLHDFNKSKTYYLKAQEVWASLKDSIGISTAYNNMAEYCLVTGDLLGAQQNIRKSIELDELFYDTVALMDSYQTAGEIEAKSGNYELALNYLNKAYAFNKEFNAIATQIKLFERLSKTYEVMGDYQKALQFAKLYQKNNEIFLNDSIILTINNLVEKESYMLLHDNNSTSVSKIIAPSQAEEFKSVLRKLQTAYYLLILLVAVSIVAFAFWFKYQIKSEKLKSELNDYQELHKSAEEAAKVAIAKANDAYKQQENFLHCMTHELRTPLNGIIGFASIMEEEIGDENLRNMARNITQSGNRLLATVNGLLDLSAFEDNKLEIEQSVFNLKELLFQCVEKWRQEARIKGLAIDFITELNELWVKSDYGLLDKIVCYLTDNAIKYTSEGFVKVVMSVRFSKGQQWAVIKVIDSGIGIPEDQVDLVFANFRQASEGYTRHYEGPGIGLSLSRSLITILGGYIEVESTVDNGSTFSVFLPATQQVEIEKPLQSAFINRLIANDKRPLLLVEDDETNREFATYALSKHFDIDLAANGKTALQLASQKTYSLILMDINLGRQMSGAEVVTVLRLRPEYANVPIAAITANYRADHRDELLVSGFTHFLAKPYTQIELKSLVRKMLGSNTLE